MDDLVIGLIRELLTPIVTAIAGAISLGIAAWVASNVPGRIRNALENSAQLSGSAVRVNDLAFVERAMQRRADAQASPEMKTGTGTGDVIRYAEEGVGDVMDKLGMSENVRETMAAAAIHKAVPLPAAVVVAAADVVAANATAAEVLVGGGGDLARALHRNAAGTNS